MLYTVLYTHCITFQTFFADCNSTPSNRVFLPASAGQNNTATLEAGRMSDFLKLVQSMFNGKQAAVGEKEIKSADGKTTYRSVQEQLKRFQEHFAEVFSCDSISAEQQAEMEQLISNVEVAIRSRTYGQQQQQEGQQQQSQEQQQLIAPDVQKQQPLPLSRR